MTMVMTKYTRKLTPNSETYRSELMRFGRDSGSMNRKKMMHVTTRFQLNVAQYPVTESSFRKADIRSLIDITYAMQAPKHFTNITMAVKMSPPRPNKDRAIAS
ncbi:hypothetical protein DQ04_08041030 [Trypanosoma grayi]|uniref:hypothetical protein n=1 Tax=Trypanosoma grayi TaxID=71804 RepID=UPI0004F4748B|nr:hypothetical protein DQ04_08041030 [Trypanosoma grayi]KEG08085.1 hypothetical protein DQ04_08041030 [Trypanosoma grayi]